MTEEEFYNLYNKIRDVIDKHEDYHCWYCCCNEIYNGTSMSFEVYIHSDAGEGHEWVEDWVIDDYGKIYSEDAIYESYEDFLKEWI